MLEILVRVGAVVVAGLIGYGIYKLSWDKVRKILRGKKIAVLGMRKVGKTTLIKFLSNGSIPSKYEQTVEAKTREGRSFELSDLELEIVKIKVDAMVDMSGDKAMYDRWEEQIKKADVVFYLFRADRFFEDDQKTILRVSQDLGLIDKWRKEKNSETLFYLIGNFCDLIPEYDQSSPQTRGDFQDKFLSRKACKAFAQYITLSRIVLGSMKDLQHTEEFVFRLFYQIQEENKK